LTKQRRAVNETVPGIRRASEAHHAVEKPFEQATLSSLTQLCAAQEAL